MSQLPTQPASWQLCPTSQPLTTTSYDTSIQSFQFNATTSTLPSLTSEVVSTSQTFVMLRTPVNPVALVTDVRAEVLRKWGLFIPRPYVRDPRISDLEEGEISEQVKDNVLFEKLGLRYMDKNDVVKQCLRDTYYFLMRDPPPKIFAPMWQLSPSLREIITGHPKFLISVFSRWSQHP
ncbi:hypothetical protein H2248_000419 [Termitomyces sp. 'cryptogamus']|nr:hypothetical protein H2248_000419 [Termitomyces sp. 'cryptogamus']